MNESLIYSYVRCPYASRARLALIFAGINCELREVDLANKPQEMLQLSPKGTVPVLQLRDSSVIDESLEVMYWVANQESGKSLMPQQADLQEMQQLIAYLDTHFSKHAFRYRFPKADDVNPRHYYRDQCEIFLQQLENLLTEKPFLFGNNIGFTDLAVYPFLRGFIEVEPEWFNATPYAKLHGWLVALSSDERIHRAYVVHKPWRNGDNPIYLMSA